MLKAVENNAVRWLQIRLLCDPVRAQLKPSRASTGGMLPVNMCGPAVKVASDWSVQHTPPQAPPPLPLFLRQKVIQAERMLPSKQWRKDGEETRREGGTQSRVNEREKKAMDLGYWKENFDKTNFWL